jgi:hypothetical protein
MDSRYCVGGRMPLIHMYVCLRQNATTGITAPEARAVRVNSRSMYYMIVHLHKDNYGIVSIYGIGG